MALFERKKKPAPTQSEHLQQQHHFQPAVQPVETPEPVEAVVENPIISPLDDQSTSSETYPQQSESAEPESVAEILSTDSEQENVISTEPEPAISEHKESPVEQKIQVLMDEPINGWNHIGSASRNGMPVRLSLTSDDNDTVLGFWKRTRSFHSKRWQETGMWCDFMTAMPLSFDPIFWKPRFD
jgi:hypothetical protein